MGRFDATPPGDAEGPHLITSQHRIKEISCDEKSSPAFVARLRVQSVDAGVMNVDAGWRL